MFGWILHLVLWQWLLSTPWTNVRKAVGGWSSFLWDCACSVESISFMDPRQTGYSSFSCHSLSSVTWTTPLWCILWFQMQFLSCLLCSVMIFTSITLKINYLLWRLAILLCLNPYTFYCMCASTWCLTHHTWGFYHWKTFILKSY